MKLILFYIVFFVSFGIKAQQLKLWVVFTDKPIIKFDAANYFTEKNLSRKKLQNLPLYDGFDLPVNNNYVNQILPFCDSITYVSRWLNAACVYCNYSNLKLIENLPFVKAIDEITSSVLICDVKDSLVNLHQGEINLLKGQTARMQANAFQQNNLTGKGITIAIIDAGFRGYEKNTLLKSLRINGQIKHTYDFIRKSKDVDLGSAHGCAVLSCIGGKLDSINVGCAYDANFLLYRTEKAFNEKFSEEEYWMAAMEEADKQGADIINTSLGYSDRRYFQKDMNGKKSLLSKAANIASRKGMLLVCSAGNEGDIDWKIICTPADADSALTVGAINPWTGIQASWSSYGPSSDKRIKPNVCAYGFVMAAEGNKGAFETVGTSFSSPLVAGFAACTRQLLPTITSYELLQTIERSADLYPYYDYAHGFGVPQASNIVAPKIDSAVQTFKLVIENDSLKVLLATDFFYPSFIPIREYYNEKEDSLLNYTDVNGDKYLRSVHFSDNIYGDSRVSSLHLKEPGYFYYSIKNDEDLFLSEYATVNVRVPLIYKVERSAFPKTYSFYYKGYTTTVKF